MPAFLKDKAVWIPILGVILLLVVLSFFRGDSPDDDVEVTTFTNAIAVAQRGEVEHIDVSWRSMRVQLRDGTERRVWVGTRTDVVAALQGAGVPLGASDDAVSVSFVKPSSGIGPYAIRLGVPLVMIFVLYVVIRLGVRHGFEAYERRRGEPRA